jgi:hypothetical protein
VVLFHAANNDGIDEESINESTINEILTSGRGGRAEGRKGGRAEGRNRQ